MKKLHFQYEMELTLSQEVRGHHFLIRLRPMETAGQHCESFRIRVDPETPLSPVADGFGNHGCAGVVWPPHSRFFASSEGFVDVDRGKRETDYHPMYRFQSAYTAPDEAIRGFFYEACGGLAWEGEADGLPVGREPGTAGHRTAEFLMDRLYGRFSYVQGVTGVRTTAAEAFAGGQGVCQDYAHIYISLCRMAGIPARYVAGMLLGEGESHAWAEVWTGREWIGMDPTHNRPADETYIKLTHGRDFGDAAVDKGCFLGFASQHQQIYVKVEEVF